MPESSKAVFLSYASKDTEAASRICLALRAGGVEVWFDQNELRGGDAWDQKIRRQIKDCALFMPIISANTAERREGYFRLEWGLAEQRAQMIARNTVFIVPVCVDGTPDTSEDVPESFLRVQWTRLPGGNAPSSFCQRIAALLAETRTLGPLPETGRVALPAASPRTAFHWIALAAAVVVAVAVIGVKPWRLLAQKSTRVPVASPVVQMVTPPAPEKSIAVLPFVDMSEKHDQEYFSDGISEELIDRLTKIPDLYVPARTSSFFFKGKQTTIVEIAHLLNVAHILEGSVRKSGKTLRVTAQLIRVADGYHVWSQTYDRNLDDIFKVQDAVAGAVVTALVGTLAVGIASPEAPTENLDAYNEYLQGRLHYRRFGNSENKLAKEYFTRAIALDARFALAWAWKGRAETVESEDGSVPADTACQRGRESTRQALQIDPELGLAHLNLAFIARTCDWDWGTELAEIRRAAILDPSNPKLYDEQAHYAMVTGDNSAAESALRRSAAHDPLEPVTYTNLAITLLNLGKLEEATEAARKVKELNPEWNNHSFFAEVLLSAGHAADALVENAKETDESWRLFMQSLIYESTGRDDAKTAVAKFTDQFGGVNPVGVAYLAGSRGDADESFKWLEVARAQRDRDIIYVKSSRYLRSLHGDPRWAALVHELNLPE